MAAGTEGFEPGLAFDDEVFDDALGFAAAGGFALGFDFVVPASESESTNGGGPSESLSSFAAATGLAAAAGLLATAAAGLLCEDVAFTGLAAAAGVEAGAGAGLEVAGVAFADALDVVVVDLAAALLLDGAGAALPAGLDAGRR